MIFVWNAVHAKRIVFKERFFLTSAMDADVLRVSFKGHGMGQLPRAAVRKEIHVVISTMESKEERRENTQ